MRRFVQAFAAGATPPELASDIAADLCALPPRYNIAVRKPAGVLLDSGDGIHAAELQWGLVPRWSALPETSYTTVTARLERAPTSRIFRRPWQAQRCVVPMNGYYKWDRSGRPARPYFIQRQDGQLLFAAGLWDHWDRQGPSLYSFALLTHPNRAIPPPLVPDGPVFLPAARIAQWIAGPPSPQRLLDWMELPALEAYPVSRAIRHREPDDYTLLEPADEALDAAPDDVGDLDVDYDEGE